MSMDDESRSNLITEAQLLWEYQFEEDEDGLQEFAFSFSQDVALIVVAILQGSHGIEETIATATGV